MRFLLNRKFLAFLLPNILHIVLTLIVGFLYRNSRDQAEANVPMLLVILTISFASAFILGKERFGKFWKTYSFVVFTTFFPYATFFTIMFLLGKTGGYFYLGLIGMSVMGFFISFVILPVTFCGVFMSENFDRWRAGKTSYQQFNV